MNFESGERFASRYNGENWAAVTHLPLGWEILDFGTPKSETAFPVRFQQSRHHLVWKAEDTGTLRCVQSSDGKVRCGPPPPSTDPDHGSDPEHEDEDDPGTKSPSPAPSTEKTAGVVQVVQEPALPTDNKLNAPTDDKTSKVTKDLTAPISTGGKPTDGKPAAPTDGKPAAPTDGTPAAPADGKPATPTNEKIAQDQKQVTAPAPTDGKPTASTAEKIATDKQEKKYVVGGGFVITMVGLPMRTKSADRLIEDNKQLHIQKLPATTMDQIDKKRDLAPSAMNRLKEAEVACAKSHIHALKRVADPANQPRDALWFIFEDDVKLKPNFLDQVIRNIKSLNRPWDVLNAWLMPPRRPARGSKGVLNSHMVIPDGYWGMQGYVVTPDSAARLLKCLDPPSHQVWAQVDEMIGCCAAMSKDEPYTRCVYRTEIPVAVELDLHAYCMTPALLVHMDRALGSYAHRNKKKSLSLFGLDPDPGVPTPPLITGLSLVKDDEVQNVQSKIRELESKMGA